MKYSKLIFGSIASLILGTSIYILFRSSTLKVFSWLNYFGINILDSNIRKSALEVSKNIPDWVLLSLPDGLWLFSYVCLMLYIWKNSITIQNLFWISIIPAIAIASEVAQCFGILQGTFDPMDLMLYILGGVLPLLIFKNSINYELKF
ncbi:hypothetical protein [Epilithonimonas zeae]|uniref:hypothetical protein n=1 Tax=Epilithonimonas zeae TaxID=1416779 RepID=UPI0020109C0E|nr:hypothetical protein [Epilithonimonas zeae]UQB67586.1 hypothetical protein KI430_11095 [Epilithonimonas zeae]